jgi:hypothetical protein
MTLDATVAGASADSYLTVADAAALAGADMGPEADLWLKATTTTADKEKALKRATSEIDGYVRSGWPKYSTDQALTFPRSIDTASDVPFIPADIRRAAYHQAAYVLKNKSVIDRANARHARALSQYSEDGLSGSVDDDSVNIISPRAMHYLADYGKASKSGPAAMSSARISSGFAS